MSFPRYPKYKDSGVEWLGEVPAHWAIERLKHSCRVFPSNVDKKSKDGEIPVRLCNYTDVYYHDVITDDMDLMPATATAEQVGRFTLRAGDTVITKDSETADDIAISAYVPADLPGVLCGYHLAVVRPSHEADGAYIKRVFDSMYAKARFAVLANGLTRVGLGQYELDNVTLPLPPRSEQAPIARFLDRETAKIDELVAKQRRLMELLKEKRQAIISHAVTKGLNPDAPMKPSGIEWLGDIPAHWDLRRIKHLASAISKGTTPTTVDAGFAHDGIRFIKAENITEVGVADSPAFFISEETHALLGRSSLVAGDVLVVIAGATTGKSAVLSGHLTPANTNQAVSFIRLIDPRYSPYVALWLATSAVRDWISLTSVQSAQPNLSMTDLGNIPVPVPPPTELGELLVCVSSALSGLDRLTVEAQRVIDLLQERRFALISAAVTGQIDVRGLAEAVPA